LSKLLQENLYYNYLGHKKKKANEPRKKCLLENEQGEALDHECIVRNYAWKGCTKLKTIGLFTWEDLLALSYQ